MQEPVLSDKLFQKFSDLFFHHSGIRLKEHKKYLIMHRLNSLIGPGHPFNTFEDYYEALRQDMSGELMKELINRLTTNFSYFFRDKVHFDFLDFYIKKHYYSPNELRLWSAASSTGEEAYTMAITVLKNAPAHINSNKVKILGTDISNDVLKVAYQGSYSSDKLEGHVSESNLKKFFNHKSQEKTYTAKNDLKKLIKFRYLNLFHQLPFQKQFDIVFLRNVLIYFDNKEKEEVLNKIYHHIKPNGYIILGLSESLAGINTPFFSLKYSIYKKTEF